MLKEIAVPGVMGAVGAFLGAVVMICAPADGRPAFRVGAWDRNGRKHSEDGADDHVPKANSESVR
jgi:hypothetical protein